MGDSRHWFADALLGLEYLHFQGVAHFDLKPDNILIDDVFNAKLADFGTSRETDLEKTMETAGTPLFMAPELLRRERYNEKVDVWSFACVLECMWTHRRVYHRSQHDGHDPGELIRRVENDMLRPKTGCLLREVANACSVIDPEQRCSFEQVLTRLSEPSIAAEAARIPSGPLPLSFSTERPLAPTPRSATPDTSPLPSPHAIEQQSPAVLPQPGRRASWARKPSFLKRQHSDLHGFDDDHGVASEAKDGPGRLHEREASIRRHTQHLRTQQVARRRKSQDAVHGAVSFVTKLRRSSRATSSHASSSAASEGSERSEPGSAQRVSGVSDSESARDVAEASAAAATPLATAAEDEPRVSATASEVEAEADDNVVAAGNGTPVVAQRLTAQERVAQAIEEHDYNAPENQRKQLRASPDASAFDC